MELLITYGIVGQIWTLTMTSRPLMTLTETKLEKFASQLTYMQRFRDCDLGKILLHLPRLYLIWCFQVQKCRFLKL